MRIRPEERPLPKGGVSLRYRWVLIFPEEGEIRGFKTIEQAKEHCADRWGVTKWERSWNADWTPGDGDSWISDKGELWPGR